MLKDVTLGRYYSSESVIHRLDPRTKIRFVIVYSILILLDRNVPLFVFLTAVFAAAVLLCRVPISYMLKGSRGIFAVLLVCSAINIFTTNGETLLHIGFIRVTEEGLLKFAFVFWRMALLVLMSSILMYTTKPTTLADGIEKCFHVSGGIAMGITIALRFVSVLFEELDRIMKAQEARGACFNSGGLFKRVKSMRTIIVPLFQNALDRAGKLGEALDARCYKGGTGRTKLEPLVYDWFDILAYFLMLGMTAAGVYFIFKF